MKRFVFEGKPLINACAVIALLMNADGLRKNNQEFLNAQDVWNSNSHGELFGIFISISILDSELNEKFNKLNPEMCKFIDHAIETGEIPNNFPNNIAIDGEWATGIGILCAEQLWINIPTF